MGQIGADVVVIVIFSWIVVAVASLPSLPNQSSGGRKCAEDKEEAFVAIASALLQHCCGVCVCVCSGLPVPGVV